MSNTKYKMDRHTFKFNSNTGETSIDGFQILSVTDLKIERHEREKVATITLKFDAKVEIEGALILKQYVHSDEQLKEILNPPQK